ncbi:MAG: SRPBCC family protein [Myxococcota bacterium]
MIKTFARTTILARRERVFDIATANETLPRVFEGYGPVPAIREATIESGRPPGPGEVRLVSNSDGSTIREEIDEWVRPRSHRYRLVSGFDPPFSWLIRSASGRWAFEEISTGTRVTWRFVFEPASAIAAPLVSFIAAWLFQPAQVRCLSALKELCEADQNGVDGGPAVAPGAGSRG